MRKIAIFILCCLSVIGCSNIKQGEVVKKEFIPAHNRVALVPICVSNGKTVTTIMVPYIYYYPDTYKIEIKAKKKDKYIYKWIYVNKYVYDLTPIGAEFIYDKKRDMLERPYTRQPKND